MKITDITIRKVYIDIEYHEIIKLIIDKIRIEHQIKFTQFDKFDFEFIKEGSPAYNTSKIKCKVIKEYSLSPPEPPKAYGF